MAAGGAPEAHTGGAGVRKPLYPRSTSRQSCCRRDLRPAEVSTPTCRADRLPPPHCAARNPPPKHRSVPRLGGHLRDGSTRFVWTCLAGQCWEHRMSAGNLPLDLGELLARFCMSFVFLWSGITKACDRSAGKAEIAELGLPYRKANNSQQPSSIWQ